jgi:hypothetical protein
MSKLIEKTSAAKAAEKAQQIKNGYTTVLNILEKDLQGAEFIPGGILSLKVAAVIGDEFDAALKGSIGSDVLCLGFGVRIWRATTSRGTIYVEGLDSSKVDEGWDALIEEIKLRIEL